jgi:hypothetical protein
VQHLVGRFQAVLVIGHYGLLERVAIVKLLSFQRKAACLAFTDNVSNSAAPCLGHYFVQCAQVMCYQILNIQFIRSLSFIILIAIKLLKFYVVYENAGFHRCLGIQ